jgi:hypothetical protein
MTKPKATFGVLWTGIFLAITAFTIRGNGHVTNVDVLMFVIALGIWPSRMLILGKMPTKICGALLALFLAFVLKASGWI